MAESTATTIRAGDHETYLNRAGEGNEEAILFLHGSGPGVVSWSNWQFALPALGERYDCLAPDLAGFGKSEHPENPPEGMNAWMDIWIEQNIALLDDLGLGRVNLVGNSMGGAIALHLTHRHPERVGRVALMGPVGPPHRITEQLDGIWGFYDEPTAEHMKELINWFAYDPRAAVGEDLDRIAKMRLEAAVRPEVRRSFEAMFAPPRQRHLDDLRLPEEAYARLENPTLLIHGRDDHIIPLKTSLFLLEHLPHVQLHVFGRCGHWTMIEYRHTFNRLLEDFFGEES
ncbi:MAG: alpha/beta fold hydrolase [Rubrobacteraceae bacterium]|nr:alpha/beta fold hydrolase [Rubrobacteraceae bacterium]